MSSEALTKPGQAPLEVNILKDFWLSAGASPGFNTHSDDRQRSLSPEFGAPK
jgi:hypothetical protein